MSEDTNGDYPYRSLETGPCRQRVQLTDIACHPESCVTLLLSPGDHRVAKAAHQVRMVAQFAKDPNGSEGSHCAAQDALHLRRLQELSVQSPLIGSQAAK